MTTDMKESGNTIQWTVQAPGMNKSFDVLLRPYLGEEQAPEGYARLVTVERMAVLEGSVLDQIKAKFGGRDGVIKSAIFLEEQLGHTLPRHRCIRIVKDIVNPKRQNQQQFAVLLRGSYWVSEEDGARIENIRGVRTHGKDNARIEAEIEWPDNIPETSEIDAELSRPPQQNRVVAPPRGMLPVRAMTPDSGTKRPNTSASIKKLPPGEKR